MSEGWVKPEDQTFSAEYWLTRRDKDCASGYEIRRPDVRVKYRWSPQRHAWTGTERQTDDFVLLHSNKGWRLEGAVKDGRSHDLSASTRGCVYKMPDGTFAVSGAMAGYWIGGFPSFEEAELVAELISQAVENAEDSMSYS